MGLKVLPVPKMAVPDMHENITDYNALCLSLLKTILLADKYRITYVDPEQFKDSAFGSGLHEMNYVRPADAPLGTAFIAQYNNKKILFCFDDQGPARLKKLAHTIKESDNGQFDTICILIVRDPAKMADRRKASKADEWPRGFFLCFEEIQRKAEELDKGKCLRFYMRGQLAESRKQSPIMSVTAEVKENIPVGEDKGHYKLRFETARSFNITAGQFIMTDTGPQGQDKMSRPVPLEKTDPSLTAIRPYLKRPFGIHRSFYKHFDKDYLKKLSLPPELATVLHTVFPNEFEIFYKVLPDGIGTQELSKLQKGANIKIVGPLGKGRIIDEIRDKGFEEVHVIGGGVGMAPLIFMVQALRYYSYNVKAFIGTENIGMLKYKQEAFDGLDATFTDDDPTIYVDDLFDAGMNRNDIYVSSIGPGSAGKKIPKKNSFKGLVTDQYMKYLKDTHAEAKKTLAFGCGPMGMMKALLPITGRFGIPLKVLMEKRMACGIGVCLSCVCETKKPEEAESRYSRVCTDGPVFDAGEIIWE